MSPTVPHLLDACDATATAAEALVAKATLTVRARIAESDLDTEQRAAHALSWYATYAQALRQMARWARHLDGEQRFGPVEQLIPQAAFGEYCAQMAGGIAMSQNEIARPYDLGLT